MTFLNPILLIGLAGVAIPVLIHLLNRRRARVVQWGAMRFLLEAMASQNRRIRIEEIILLAMRCLLVALLAMALARPFLPSRTMVSWALVIPAVLIAAVLVAIAAASWSQRRTRTRLLAVAGVLILLAGVSTLVEQVLQHRFWESGAGDKDIVLVIDGSMSMTVEVDGKSNFQRAIDEARAVVEAARPADAFGIVLAGEVPEEIVPAPSSDRREVLARLDSLQPVGGVMRVGEAMESAARCLAEGSNAGKKVLIITDRQSTGWQLDDPEQWEHIARRLTQPREGKALPTKPTVVCRTLSLPETFNNAALAAVTLGRSVVGTDRDLKITAEVANTGTSPITPAAVELTVDGGQPETLTTQEIEPGSSETVTFEHRFDQPGRHMVQVRVAVDDDLADDNLAVRCVEVAEKLPVLVIDGSVAGDESRRVGRYVADALAPIPSGDDDEDGPTDPNDEIRCLFAPEVVELADVGRMTDLGKYALFVLANVPELPSDIASAIAEHVQTGAGLMIACGQWSQPAFYNEWSTSAGLPVAPARLGEKRQVRPEQPAKFATRTFSHPALSRLAAPRRVDEVQVFAYWPMTLDSGDPDVQVGGLLDDGSPLLVERRLGEGRIAQLPVSLQRSDTTLTGKGNFVTFVHELATYLSGGMLQQPNLQPGERMFLSLGTGGSRRIGTGLLAEYYDGWEFTDDKRRVSRIDPVIDFNWHDSSPAKGVPSDDFAVRWTGKIRPRYDGEYAFTIKADDGANLWVDGQRLLYGDDRGKPGGGTAKIKLESGKRYDIRLEHFEGRWGAQCRLTWASAKQPEEVVPQSCLFPPDEPGKAAAGDSVLADLVRRGAVVTVRGPNGREMDARLENTGQGPAILFDATRRPGTYRISAADPLDKRLAMYAVGDGSVPFVVVEDSSESRLDALTEESLGVASKQLDNRGSSLLLAGSVDELTASITGEVPGEEWWKYLIVGVVLLVLGEIALARWIAAKRRTHSAQEVEFATDAVDVEDFRRRAKALAGGQSQPQEAMS